MEIPVRDAHAETLLHARVGRDQGAVAGFVSRVLQNHADHAT